MNVEERLAGLRKRLAAQDAPAMLVTTVSNLRYLTGFRGVIDSGINAACLVTQDRAWFYTDHRYVEAATEAASGSPWDVRVQQEDLYAELCRDVRDSGIDALLVESSITYERFASISEKMDGSVRAAEHCVEDLRQVKEPEEVERIAHAAEIADAGFAHIVTFIRPGLTEREVAFELESYMRRHGSDGLAFDIIAAAGPNAARPHAIPGDRVLAAGDLLILDFGAKYADYRSDMTRTIVLGRPSDEQRRMHETVLAANEAGLAAVRAGVACVDVDRAARSVIEQAGLGEHFTHGLGHGVGLDIHEMPTVSARSRESLQAGMVVTIEPGVYVEGFGGVRIEDLVVVDEAGYRLLSHAPRQLIEI